MGKSDFDFAICLGIHGFTMVRHYLILLGFIGITAVMACQNDGSGKTSENKQVSNSESVYLEGPKIVFDTTSYNFGKVYEGEKVGWYFKYRNTGDKNLILTNVTAGCGCTIPDYSKEPLSPGKRGEIKVVFDSEGRVGHQYKTISVESNGQPKMIELIITAEIIKK